jgi:fucose 4-O-acetylase-like acetyltransferase
LIPHRLTANSSAELELGEALGGHRDRVVWLDYAKGIGIVLVVFGHVISGLRVPQVGPDLYTYDFFRALIYTFHMPLFFFVSGMLFVRSFSGSKGQLFRVQALRILIPYLVWSVLFVALQNTFPWAANHHTEFVTLLQIPYNPLGHLWFLYALFIAQTAFFVAQRLFGSVGILAIGGGFAAAYIFSLGMADSLYGDIAMGGTFFGTGLVAAGRRPIDARSKSMMGFIVVAAIWFATALARLEWSAFLEPISAVAGISMIVTASKLLPDVRGVLTLSLAQLGQASLAIFLTHVVFSAGVRSLLYLSDVHDCDVHVLVGTLAGVSVPTLLFLAASRLELLPYAGFGTVQRSPYAGTAGKDVSRG